MTAVAITGLPGTQAERLSARALLLGERIDIRGLERERSLAAAPLALRLEEGGIAVLFRFGVAVLFGATATAESVLLEKLAPFVSGPYPARESDETQLRIGGPQDEGVDVAGAIFLKQPSIERLQLVADALAKSLVLAHYEARIADLFDRIDPLAATLREKGRTGASGTELLRQIGRVLSIQHKMVGRVETGEKPELLWDHPELERLHLFLAEEYELRERSRALERKLDVISRTMETLLSLVRNRSNLRVEWYIVALIVAELALTIYTLALPR